MSIITTCITSHTLPVCVYRKVKILIGGRDHGHDSWDPGASNVGKVTSSAFVNTATWTTRLDGMAVDPVASDRSPKRHMSPKMVLHTYSTS